MPEPWKNQPGGNSPGRGWTSPSVMDSGEDLVLFTQPAPCCVCRSPMGAVLEDTPLGKPPGTELVGYKVVITFERGRSKQAGMVLAAIPWCCFKPLVPRYVS